MAKEMLGFLDYVKAAFNWKVRVSGLGFMPLNKFILAGFAIIGFGHAGFWFLGLAYEIGYLLYLAGNPRFQKLVQGSMLKDHAADWQAQQARILKTLEKPGQERYRRLEQSCVKITETAQNLPGTISIEGIQSGDLNQLLWIFLRLLHSCQRINQILAQTSRKGLDQEISAITAQLSKEPENSPIYRSLKGTLEIQERRLENLAKAEESLKVSETELDRIEKQVQLINEEMTVSGDPKLISFRLDGVMQSLQGTTKWMSEHTEFFGAPNEYPVFEKLLPVAPDQTGSDKK